MKLSSFVAVAATAALTLLDGASAGGHYTPITGAVNAGVVERLPVQKLAENKDAFNMFLWALHQIQNINEMNDLSWYRIAGIHGIPYVPWQEPVSDTQDDNLGYCHHNSALFPTWHRPYLALLEQRLVAHALWEATKYKGAEAERWKAAAKQIRLPFWDWASADLESKEPPQMKVETVTVTRPKPGGGSEVVSIPNPLFSYIFQNTTLRTEYFRDQFLVAKHTARQPPTSLLTSSNNNAVDSAMTRDYQSRRQSTYGLFSIPTFREFSNTQVNSHSQPNSWSSVESVHNTVHNSVGGQYGQMTAVPYSAYDPAFWMHHVNIDRLIAMYQAVKPGSKVEPQPATGSFSRMVTSSKQMDDINTPLNPFRKTNGQYYTSNDVSDASSIWNLGYAYPEVPAKYKGDTSGLKKYTTSRVNALYAPSSSSRNKRDVASGKRTEWICHMAFDAAEVPGSAQVQVYLSQPFSKSNSSVVAPHRHFNSSVVAPHRHFNSSVISPYNHSNSSAARWHNSSATDYTDSNGLYVGSASSFLDISMAGKMVMDITGAVYMTDAILAAGCPSLDAKDVTPFLRKNLKWIIKLGGEQEYPLDRVKSLKVGVSSADLNVPSQPDELPTYGKFQTHIDVTANKVGGFVEKDMNLVDSVVAPIYNDHGVKVPSLSDLHLPPLPKVSYLPISIPSIPHVGGYGSSTKPTAAYPTKPAHGSYGAPPSYPPEEGSSTKAAAHTKPAYGSPPSYGGAPPSYPSEDGSPSKVAAHHTQPAYGSPPSYGGGAPPSYPSKEGSPSEVAAHHTQPAHGSPPSYGGAPPPSYPSEEGSPSKVAAHHTQPAYGAPPSYPSEVEASPVIPAPYKAPSVSTIVVTLTTTICPCAATPATTSSMPSY